METALVEESKGRENIYIYIYFLHFLIIFWLTILQLKGEM